MKILINSLLLCAVIVVPVHALAETLDETRSVAADATVSVSNVAGEIEISTWDRNEIHLSGNLGNNQEMEITESASGIRIEVRHIEDSISHDESEINLVIPVGASVVAESVSADISVTDSRGTSLALESVSGDITVDAETSRLEMSSVSGDVEFEGASTRSSLDSVSGDISLEGVSGEITISSVSGDVELMAGSVSEGNFDTVSGTLELNMSVADGGRVNVECMSGDVDMLLPAAQSGAFKAQSFSGDISSDFGQVKYQEFGPGSHLKHSAGDSGASIRVESFSGDIHIGHK